MWLIMVIFCLPRAIYSQEPTNNSPHSAFSSVPADSVVIFRFAPGKLTFYSPFQGNEDGIAHLNEMIDRYRDDIESGRKVIRVNGYCTSFGTVKENLRAAKNRSNQIKSYFIIKKGLKEKHFLTYNGALTWNGQKDIVALVDIADSVACGNISTETDKALPADSVPSGREPDSSILRDIPDSTEGRAQSRLRPGHGPAMPYRPRIAVKTNALMLAATVANLGLEFRLGNHLSLDIPVVYSPYMIKRDYRLSVLAAQPELRYWIKAPFKGHFFGLHAHSGYFNIAVDGKTRYQDERPFYGAGISYGYNLSFARHWGVEFTIGGGYVNTEYSSFYNIPNGAQFDTQTKEYWGLTRAGINLMYKFGGKR